MAGTGEFWATVLASLGRIALGLVWGVALGALLAVLTCASPWADRLLSPAVYPPKLPPDGLLHHRVDNHAIKGGLGLLVIAHTGEQKSRYPLLHQRLDIGVESFSRKRPFRGRVGLWGRGRLGRR